MTAAMAVAALAGAAVAQPSGLTTVVFSGEAVPGLTDTNFGSFTNTSGLRPVIADNNDVAFLSSLSGANVSAANDQTLVLRRGAGPLVVAFREGTGTVVGDSTAITAFVLSNSVLSYTVATTSGSAAFARRGTETSTLVSTATNSWFGQTVTQIAPPSVSNFGDVLVPLQLSGGAVALGMTDGDGVSLLQGLVTGQTVSGLGTPEIDAIPFVTYPINEFGEFGAYARIRNASGGSGVTAGVNDQVIIRGTLGSASLVARTGSGAAGFIAGATYSDFGVGTLDVPHININSTGRPVFSAKVSGTGITLADDTALFRGEGSVVTRLARESAPAPNTGVGVTYGEFPPSEVAAPRFTNAGSVAMLVDLGGSGSGNGLFMGEQAGFIGVAASGVQVPVLPEGVLYDRIITFACNNRNQILFLASLTGTGVTAGNDTALFAYNGEAISLVAREGDAWNTPAGSLTVESLWVNTGGTSDDALEGGRQQLNDNGIAVFAATFSGGSSGVFTYQLPAPCAVAVQVVTPARAVEGSRALIASSAPGATSLRWREDGRNLSDGATFTSTQGDTLRLNKATLADEGRRLNLLATNDCGTVGSEAVSLQVVRSGDLNIDGQNDILWRNVVGGLNLGWRTDGTPLDGTFVTGTFPLPTVSNRAWSLEGQADFNFNGTVDLLWRNIETGDISVWFMNGASFVNSGPLPRVADPNWQISGVADMTGDGINDIIWRNAALGANVVWQLNATFGTVDGSLALPSVSDPNWRIAAAADMNADGSPDLIWRNGRTGATAAWFMNGTAFASAADITPLEDDPNWVIAGVLDYNTDAKPDILWRNTVSGQNRLWLMDGVTRTNTVNLPTVTDIAWRTMGQSPFKVGVDGDFNGDGFVDLFWRHATNGQNLIWLLNGTNFGSLVPFTPITDTNWTVQAVGDLTRDNVSDIFWRNTATGQNVLWTMDGLSLRVSTDLPGVANTNWNVGAIADMDDDESNDLVWYNRATGETLIWYLNPGGEPFVRTIAASQTSTVAAARIAGAGDFNLDGRSDWAYRGLPAGGLTNETWLMSNNTRLSTLGLPSAPTTSWDMRAIADFNRDGRPDILWRNGPGALNTIWLMNGGTILQSIELPQVPDAAWNPVK
jgi:hypothetical protein